eukprot:scaffold4141_cov117-Skeletonema_dohrnii-CCMP3373.AAC.11
MHDLMALLGRRRQCVRRMMMKEWWRSSLVLQWLNAIAGSWVWVWAEGIYVCSCATLSLSAFKQIISGVLKSVNSEKLQREHLVVNSEQ